MGAGFSNVMDDTGKVHHLGETVNTRVRQEHLDFGEGECRPRVLESGSRHARGDADEYVEGSCFGVAQEQSNTLFAGHVGDLVRIHEDGGGAAPHGGLSEFQRTEQTALDMKVRIDETRNYVLGP